jgi:two-component system KDP operon response regulator KdpE
VAGEEKKIRVLIVDDEPKVLKFMTIDLKLRGFDVITAGSGGAALDVARDSGPDIIILDIIMPQMDGFEVLNRLREFCEVPVIAISSDIENRTPALGCGASDFFVKPFRTMEVVDSMNRLLA